MPNYTLVATPYTSRTFDDYIKPYQNMTEAYDNFTTAIDTMQMSVDVLDRQISRENDPISRALYDNLVQQMNDAVKIIESGGGQDGFRRLRKLKSVYNKVVPALQSAVNAKQERIKEFNALLAKDDSIIPDRDIVNPGFYSSLDRYLEDPAYTYGRIYSPRNEQAKKEKLQNLYRTIYNDCKHAADTAFTAYKSSDTKIPIPKYLKDFWTAEHNGNFDEAWRIALTDHAKVKRYNLSDFDAFGDFDYSNLYAEGGNLNESNKGFPFEPLMMTINPENYTNSGGNSSTSTTTNTSTSSSASTPRNSGSSSSSSSSSSNSSNTATSSGNYTFDQVANAIIADKEKLKKGKKAKETRGKGGMHLLNSYFTPLNSLNFKNGDFNDLNKFLHNIGFLDSNTVLTPSNKDDVIAQLLYLRDNFDTKYKGSAPFEIYYSNPNIFERFGEEQIAQNRARQQFYHSITGIGHDIEQLYDDTDYRKFKSVPLFDKNGNFISFDNFSHYYNTNLSFNAENPVLKEHPEYVQRNTTYEDTDRPVTIWGAPIVDDQVHTESWIRNKNIFYDIQNFVDKYFPESFDDEDNSTGWNYKDLINRSIQYIEEKAPLNLILEEMNFLTSTDTDNNWTVLESINRRTQENNNDKRSTKIREISRFDEDGNIEFKTDVLPTSDFEKLKSENKDDSPIFYISPALSEEYQNYMLMKLGGKWYGIDMGTGSNGLTLEGLSDYRNTEYVDAYNALTDQMISDYKEDHKKELDKIEAMTDEEKKQQAQDEFEWLMWYNIINDNVYKSAYYAIGMNATKAKAKIYDGILDGISRKRVDSIDFGFGDSTISVDENYNATVEDSIEK